MRAPNWGPMGDAKLPRSLVGARSELHPFRLHSAQPKAAMEGQLIKTALELNGKYGKL